MSCGTSIKDILVVFHKFRIELLSNSGVERVEAHFEVVFEIFLNSRMSKEVIP
jgi:hypothetical protein